MEKPITWGLVILLLGYLFIANCECGEGSTCPLNSGFNIESQEVNADILEGDVQEVETVIVEVTIADGDTTVSIETSTDSTDVEVKIDVVDEEDSE